MIVAALTIRWVCGTPAAHEKQHDMIGDILFGAAGSF
jgi:hypothetical protein